MFGNNSKVIKLSAKDFKTGSASLKGKGKSGLALLYSTTCPYCVMVKEEWEKMSHNKDGIAVFAFQTNDPDNETVTTVLGEKVGFKYVPSIVLVENGTLTQKMFDGERTADEMLKFAISSIGMKKDKKGKKEVQKGGKSKKKGRGKKVVSKKKKKVVKKVVSKKKKAKAGKGRRGIVKSSFTITLEK